MIESLLRRSRVAGSAFLVLLLTFSYVGSVLAQAPGLGHAFYGTVKVDGVAAEAGTVVSARVAGTESGNCTVTSLGLYGLVVQGEIAEDTTVHFYVDGQKADQEFAFHDGWTTELNLTAPAPSNGEEPPPDEEEPPPDEEEPPPDEEEPPTNGDDTPPGDDGSTTPQYPFPFPFPFPIPLPEEFPFGCFIATAAYGTPAAQQIDVLREFRDVVLMPSRTGSLFVALYYQVSPPVADFIAGSCFLRALVRELVVDPVVCIAEATGELWRE
ncbi:MAG: CFI-box-CTERM domain-containing protein [Dehalococcoidia bacterium]